MSTPSTPISRAPAGGLAARVIDVAEHVDVHEFLFEQGVTDSLPVVPPTRERVLAMLSAVSRDPQEVVAQVPPNYGDATVEKIAINAVMAGCRPEHFPMVLAATKAALVGRGGDRHAYHGLLATTAGAALMMVINGPIRERLGINSGLNALGHANRPSNTLGRAFRLVVRNVGGARPGEIEQAIQGGGHKWTLAFAEYEEASPWQPFHVEHGYQADEDVVSLLAVMGGPRVCIDQTSRSARQLTGSLALAVQSIGDPKAPSAPTMFVVAPEHADVYRADGWSKQDIRECLIEETARPLHERLEDERAGAGYPRYLLGSAGFSEADLDRPIAKFLSPSAIQITVAGSHAGKWTSIYTGMGWGPHVPAFEFVPASAAVTA